MKATDLMIGDWVRYHSKLIKVTSLYAKPTKEGDFVSNEVGWSYGVTTWVDGDFIEPIPLTPEILVLNGFEKVPTAPHNYFNSDLWDCDVIINISEDTYKDTWHVYNFTDHNDNAFVCFSLCYVHELQHALRLCGLNELAYNLKLEE